jgi:hypothetical protein
MGGSVFSVLGLWVGGWRSADAHKHTQSNTHGPAPIRSHQSKLINIDTNARTNWRASALRSGLTESSKSNVRTSAGLDSAFFIADGRHPGVKRTLRRGYLD